MSSKNKDILRRLTDELWNQKKLDLIDQFYLPEYRDIGPGVSEVKDLDGFRESTKMTFTTFPDFHADIVDTIEEGDTVVGIWNCQGTFKAEYRGTPPNNEVIKWSGITVYRMQNGKIKECVWGYDTRGAAQMMGMIPSMAATA